MSKLYTKPEWLASYAGQVPHPIFRIVGTSHFTIEPDELHVMYLGTVQYLLGSVLYLLVFKKMDKRPADNMSEIWQKIVAYYRTHGVPGQFSNLDISSFCDPQKPHGHSFERKRR